MEIDIVSGLIFWVKYNIWDVVHSNFLSLLGSSRKYEGTLKAAFEEMPDYKAYVSHGTSIIWLTKHLEDQICTA